MTEREDPEPSATGQAPLARIVDLAPVSVVVPTCREVDNIDPLHARFARLRRETGLELEVIFVDDASGDGSVEAVAAAGHEWARMIVRRDRRGLASAVLDGFRAARHPVLVCMDGDLSHPPEVIPRRLSRWLPRRSFMRLGFDLVRDVRPAHASWSRWQRSGRLLRITDGRTPFGPPDHGI